MNDSCSSSNSGANASPKVYKKLIDYSAHRASMYNRLVDYSTHRASALAPEQDLVLDNGLVGRSGQSHSCHTRSSVSPPSSSSKCQSDRDRRARAKFLTKSASVVNLLDSTATFGNVHHAAAKSRRRRTCNARLIHSHQFRQAKLCLSDSAEDISPTCSLSLSNAALPNESLHELGWPEKGPLSAQERRAKMTWLANNTSKKDLMKPQQDLPKVLKVIHPSEEEETTSIPLEEGQGIAIPSKSTTKSLYEEQPLTPVSHAEDKKLLMKGSMSLRDLDTTSTAQQRNNKLTPVATTRRRSSTSFVAGSRIRKFNIHRSAPVITN